MFQLSNGMMDDYAGGALSTEEEAFQIVEKAHRTEAMLMDTGITVGAAAFWGWLAGYKQGLPEIWSGSGLTLDVVVGAGLLAVNVLGYGGQYEQYIAAAANGSLAHFAIKWAEKLGGNMARAAGDTVDYQPNPPNAAAAAAGYQYGYGRAA